MVTSQILHGDSDKAVPPTQAERIEDTIKANGGQVEFILFPGEGHGWRKASTIQTALDKELEFARRALSS